MTGEASSEASSAQQQFEVWAVLQAMSVKRSNGTYDNLYTAVAWESWQAAQTSGGEGMREALTPSGETKAAYHGEFEFVIEDQLRHPLTLMVPWTTIKEIMAAILKRSATPPAPRGQASGLVTAAQETIKLIRNLAGREIGNMHPNDFGVRDLERAIKNQEGGDDAQPE